MYFISLQSTHCIKKTLTVSCMLLCESGDRVKVDKSSFSAYLHAVMLRHHCSEYALLYRKCINVPYLVFCTRPVSAVCQNTVITQRGQTFITLQPICQMMLTNIDPECNPE